MKKVIVNPTPTESKSVTPTTSELIVTPSEGKHLSQVVVGAVEDVTPEVNAQTPVITQILEGLVGKAQGANATADKILEGYSAYVGQELVNGTATKSGQYVWKKLTAQGGDFVDFITDDLETKYPDGGTQDGYWYEKVVEGIPLAELGCTKYAIDKFTLTSATSLSSISHSLGEIPKMALITANNSFSGSSKYSYSIIRLTATIGPNNVTAASFSGVTSAGTYDCQGVGSSGNSTVSNSTTINLPSDMYFEAGVEYTLITMA